MLFQKYEKCSLSHLKSSFRSRDIQIFVSPFSTLFLPVSHSFRVWPKINLKFYDIINCLNKNLIITHFVWYLGKEKRYAIDTLSIDRVLHKEYFYGKIMQKMCTKFDDVIWSGFWVTTKFASANLCKPIHDIIIYSTSIYSFVSEKCGKEGKKLQKSEYLEKEKSFLDEIKNIFHGFSRAIIWWKNKNLIKNSRHKL